MRKSGRLRSGRACVEPAATHGREKRTEKEALCYQLSKGMAKDLALHLATSREP